MFWLVRRSTCGDGTCRLFMVRRRSTVRFRKGALVHRAFSSVQPSTLPSEKCHSSGTHDAAEAGPSPLFLEMEHSRGAPAPGRGTRFVLRPAPTRRPPLWACALRRVRDAACSASLFGSRTMLLCLSRDSNGYFLSLF